MIFAACLGDDPIPASGQAPDAATTGTPGSPDDGAASDTAPPNGDAGSDAESSIVGPSVRCSNGQLCRVPDETCCVEADGSAACTPLAACAAISNLACDSRDDCPAGQFCCGRTTDETYWSSSCAPPSVDGVACAERPLCRSLADCPDGGVACIAPDPSFFPPGFLVCSSD